MPYIPKERREECDWVVSAMVYSDVDEPKIKADGDLNYILFTYAKHHIPQNYNSIKNYIGELNECIAEIRREILAPYEDKKKDENGAI